MANEYLDQLQANADQTGEPANPYLDMLQSEQTGKTAALRGTLTSTTAVNPDQYAQKKRVAEYLGYPTAAVEAQPHLETQARVKEIDQLTEGTPALRQKYTDPNFSKLAHDDADTLSKIESAIRNFGKAAMSGLYNANAGIVGVAQAPFDLAAPLLNPLVGTVLPENPLSRVASGLSGYRQGIEARAKMTTPQADNTVEAGWYSGVSSLAANTANLPLLFAGPAGQRAYMTAMVAPVGGQAYGQARDQGLSPTQSAVFGASQAAIEYGTEQLGLPALVGMLKPGKFGTKAIEYLIKEQGGEQIATALQDLNEWSTLPENKDRTFADYLRERPSAALQTAIATTVGGGGQVAVARVLQSAAGRIEQQRAMADQGEQGAQFLAGLDQLAAASKVRARDAGSFQEFIAQAAEDGPVDAVYISAQQLAQTDIVQQLAQVSPSVAQQLPEALATGGAIRIPVDEYATRIAGTELSQPLLDHLRTEPNGFSRAEAKTFMQNEGDQLQAEIEQQLATQQASDEFKAQADVVRNEIRTQLDALGRFTPEANDSYAQVMGSFYAVTAAKLGVSPQELWAQYPISVQSGALGGQALEQGGPRTLDEVRQRWESAGIRNAISERNGTITLSQIIVPEEARGSGRGTEAMQSLVDYADRTGQSIALSPSADFGGSKKRLTQFYKRFGFVENKGRNKDYTTMESMVRPARALNQSTRTGAVTRQDLAWSATGQNANGPVFAGRNFILDPVKAIPVEDGDFAPGGMAELGIMGHAAHVTEGATPYVFSILRPNQQTAGQLVADVRDGEVVAIHDIEIYDKGKGLGADVVASIAANTEGPVKVVEALDQSEDFWRKLGLDGLDQYRNGSIDWSGASHYYTNRNGLADRSQRTAESGAGASDLAGSAGALEGFSARELSPEEIAALEAQGFKLHQSVAQPYTADTINVDGKERPATNSKGQRIAQTEEGLRNFWRWFGDSKVVDAEGKPLVVYHGTNADFKEFNTEGGSGKTYQSGAFFTPSATRAATYAPGRDGGSVMPVYLKIENPVQIDALGKNWNAIGKQAKVLTPKLVVADEDEILMAELEGRNPDPSASKTIKARKTSLGQLFPDEFQWGDETFSTDDLSRWAKKEGYEGAEIQNVMDHGPSGVFASDEARAPSSVWVAFHPEQIKSATGNSGAFDPQNPSILAQAQQNQQARGSYTPDTGVITLMKQANLSTFLHESGHAFLDLQTKIANQLAAKDPTALTEGERSILKDTQAIMEWFGLRDLAEWNSLEFEQMRPLHEQWARGFESYLFEGKAPNIELQGVFQRFRAWLLNIYRSAQVLNVEITDDVRGVMDRMLATTEQIQIAERNRSMLPLFESAQQAGMTEQEFADYQALGVDATNEAIQDLQARGLRDMQYIHNARGREIKRLQKESKARRAEVEMDVRREVMSEPVYQAWQFLTSKGENGAPAGKIRIADVAGDDALWARMKKYKMTAADGMPADLVAERFGFTSGDHLIRALAEADTPQDAIEGLTDARMLEMYGELSSPEAIEREADKAIHSGVRVRMLATEANALAKATGQRKILTKAAKQFAETMIARLQIRAIRPTMYANAEARAAKNAADASRSGDLATAAAEKRNQIVQHYATRAAYDAQDEVERSLRYLRKFEKDSTRKNIDPDYTDQIDAMLERFDLRRATTLKAIDKRTRLAAWLESQREQGLEPDIPPELQDEAFRKSYKEMTVEEFRGLVDSVRQIEHLGRLKNQLLTSKAIRDYQAVRDLLVASINENAGDRQAVTRTPTTKLGKMAAGLRRFGANHIKAATWARIMDGGKDGGPMWEYMIRTANERGDMETQMRSDATVELSRIMTPVLKLGKMGGAGKFFPSVGRSFNRESLLAIALNTGNQGNLQRLLGGEGWTVDQVRPMLESLTAEEWRAVQSVWDYFETFRPQIAAKERRVYGKEPDWVEPQPFEIKTADGETVSVKGGYYPIKYDPVASERAESHADAEEARRQMQGAYTSATTRRSFTKSRVEEVSGRPLLYSLAGVYSGVNDVVHDLAWHEWLIDSNKLLRSQSIDNAIRSKYGPEVKQQFKKWVEDVAAGEARAEGAAAEAAGWLRRGISAAGLGFNATSAAMQVLGFNQSIVRVGPTWVARGIAQYIGHPLRSTREVTEKSKFMADRSRTQMRELNELRNRVEGQTKAGEILTGGTYFLMMRAQQMVDVPTWMGAYEKAIAEGNDEERAIALSDQAVIDAQGSGMVKDLAAIERGGPVSKLFTVFYSFMNTALNAGVSVGMTEKNKGKLAAQMLMLYTVPAVLGALMKDAITPGGGDDDDLEKLARKLAAEQLSYLMGLFVFAREFQDAAKIITGAEGARDYSGPAGTRLVGDSLKFMNQAKQGEFDDAFRKSSINLLGDFTGLPAAQINRTWTGVNALSEGETNNPAAAVFGYQKQ